jgi:hypothetical protein
MKKSVDQYYRFPRQLLNSHAWAVLNLQERRAFDCLMEEHQSKSGFVNGGLVRPKKDFVRWRVHPKHVKTSLLVLGALGIIKCTRNMGGSKIGRTPNMYLPTFLPTKPTANDATHEYLEIKTMEEAERRAELHRSREKRKGRIPKKPKKLQAVSAPSILTSLR